LLENIEEKSSTNFSYHVYYYQDINSTIVNKRVPKNTLTTQIFIKDTIKYPQEKLNFEDPSYFIGCKNKIISSILVKDKMFLQMKTFNAYQLDQKVNSYKILANSRSYFRILRVLKFYSDKQIEINAS
jgi:hypothetical protein